MSEVSIDRSKWKEIDRRDNNDFPQTEGKRKLGVQGMSLREMKTGKLTESVEEGCEKF